MAHHIATFQLNVRLRVRAQLVLKEQLRLETVGRSEAEDITDIMQVEAAAI